MSQEMRILLLTNEYPPHIYGGAGVHVEYLARELATLACVEVRTFGTQEVQQEHLHVRGLRSENAAVAAAPPHLASPLHALNTWVTVTDCLTAYGIDPAHPYVLFLGRMTQQKGLRYLLEAIPYLTPEVQVVLCAGAADTPEMAQEIEATVTRLQQQRSGIIWIPTMVPRRTSIALYSHAAVFCCPS